MNCNGYLHVLTKSDINSARALFARGIDRVKDQTTEHILRDKKVKGNIRSLIHR